MTKRPIGMAEEWSSDLGTDLYSPNWPEQGRDLRQNGVGLQQGKSEEEACTERGRYLRFKASFAIFYWMALERAKLVWDLAWEGGKAMSFL